MYFCSFVSGSAGVWLIKAGLDWETLLQTAVARVVVPHTFLILLGLAG